MFFIKTEQGESIGEAGVYMSKLWDLKFNILVDYYNKYGRVPNQLDTHKGEKIGYWLQRQKRMFKKGELSGDKIERLNESVPIWCEGRGEDNFRLLAEFYEEHGRFPSIKEKYKGKGLGIWLSKQRTLYRKGEIKEKDMVILDNISEDWVEKDELCWDDKFELLKECYDSTNKVSNLPKAKNGIYKGVNIRTWLVYNRKLFKEGKLSEDRIAKLISVDDRILMDSLDRRWDIGYNKLKEYYDKFGTKPNMGNTILDGYDLGGWYRLQVETYRKGKMSGYRLKKLEELDKKWYEVREIQVGTEDNYKKIKEFCEIYRIFPRFVDKIDGVNIGTFLYVRLGKYKQGEMSDTEIEHLNRLDSNWVNGNGAIVSWANKEGETLEERLGSIKIEDLVRTSLVDDKILHEKGINTAADYIKNESIPFKLRIKTMIELVQGLEIKNYLDLYLDIRISSGGGIKDIDRFATSIKDRLTLDIGRFKEEYREVIVKRYGLGCDALTLAEIGEIQGVTKEGVRRRLNAALKKFKRYKTGYEIIGDKLDGLVSDNLLDEFKAKLFKSNELGTNTENWIEKYRLIAKYYNENKSMLEIADVYDGVNLGYWLRYQRTKFNSGNLEDFKVELMEILSKDWDCA